jgi:glycosyltransferase involved in cell wall biosynthesis
MHVGMVAPPWIPVPPPAYGGTEAVIESLVRGLSARGIDVTLFAHPDSTAAATVLTADPPAHGVHMGDAMTELAWAAAADLALSDVDIVHHHTFAGAVCSSPDRTLVMTNHGPFEPRSRALVEQVARRSRVVAISRSHAATAPVPVSVVQHGVDIEEFPFGDGGGGYLMFLGRLDPSKGAHIAIEVANRAGLPLLIAAKMRDPHERRFYKQFIAPALGERVRLVEEPGRRQARELLAGAVALVNPIRWKEPFGMVMIEAQACGTPVLAFSEGAAPELVAHGRTGFLSSSVDEMVRHVAWLRRLERGDVRAHVEEHFSARRMVDQYVQLYDEAWAATEPCLQRAV